MVQKIDKDLLRKRAEHNDGELSSLEEITLHQFDIEKIENLDVYCRKLRILLLQNNQISKIENLHKLKQLRYLNLALNNVKKIENLSGCESLTKLDLTVNFVENILDIESLKDNIYLRELFLVGNPCYNKEGYRDFVIATLPQLKFLDGIEIQKSERIAAMQNYNHLRKRFVKESIEMGNSPSEEATTTTTTEQEEVNQPDQEADKESQLEKKRQEFQTKPVAHTPEARLQTARDLAAFREKDTDNTNTKKSKQPDPVLFGPDGRVLQRNQGKWTFHLDTSPPDTIVLDVEISKFMDSSYIDVDVHPTWIRIVIKNKVLQLVLDEEVMTESVVCERSRLTGHLMVTMLKAKSQGKDIVEIVSNTKRANSVNKIGPTATNTTSTTVQQRNRRFERLFDPQEAVDVRNIVKEEKIPTPASITAKENNLSTASVLPESLDQFGLENYTSGKIKIKDTKFLQIDIKADTLHDGFVDNPDVPPLC